MRSAILLVALVGCGTTSMSGDDQTPVDCSTIMGVDTFTVGLEKLGASGNYDFKLMSAMPSPPARGDNVWVLQVNAMTSGAVGAPVTGASLTVTPYMPAHQHGAGLDVNVTDMATPGQYQLEPVNLWMPGVWVTTIQVTSQPTDSAVYRFCIPD